MQVTIGPLAEVDLVEAERIFRLAFGTFLALQDPMCFSGAAQIVRSRWLADPSAAFGAYIGRELIGSSFAAKWGSFGVFGPVTVRPDLWDKGIARRLLEVAIARFDDWQTKQLGLVTFPWSAKHVALYQKYGFWPQYLTPVMSKHRVPRRGREGRAARRPRQ
jgi:GNAT superfamily N-acetyltransferase